MNDIKKQLFFPGRFSTYPKKLLFTSEELRLTTINHLTLIRANYHTEDFSIPYCLLAMDDTKAEYTKTQKKRLQRTGQQRYIDLDNIEEGKEYLERYTDPQNEWKAVPISINKLDAILIDTPCDIDYNPDQEKYMKKSRWSTENMYNGFIRIPHILLEKPLQMNDQQRVFAICLLGREEKSEVKDNDPIFPFGSRTVKKRREELIKLELIEAVKGKNGWRYDLFNLYKLMIYEETGQWIERQKKKIIIDDERETADSIIESIVDGFHSRIDDLMDHINSQNKEMSKMREDHKEVIKLKKVLKEFQKANHITVERFEDPSYNDIIDKTMRTAVKRWNDEMDRPFIHHEDIKLANNPIFSRLFLNLNQKLLIAPVIRYMYKEKHTKRKIKSLSLHSINGANIFSELATLEGYYKAKEWTEKERGTFAQEMYHIGSYCYKKAAKELGYNAWDNGFEILTSSDNPEALLNIYNRMRGLDKYLEKIYTPTA